MQLGASGSRDDAVKLLMGVLAMPLFIGFCYTYQI